MALSLTEIRDAFAQEGDEDGNAFGANTIPTQLPDHQKRSSLVGPRLIHEKESNDQRRAAKRAARRRQFAVEVDRPPSRCAGDMKKLTTNALAFTSGLAIHHAIVHAMGLYFEGHYTTPWNRSCVTFIYPVAIILILWSIKNSQSR